MLSIDQPTCPGRPPVSGQYATVDGHNGRTSSCAKAVEKREAQVGERETAAGVKDTKLTEREVAVKDRWVECRQVETENRRQADKLEARAKALRDAAELLLQHDAMEG